ncbi:MAG: methyltransferase domain-containing protein [Betaproteobacteria bacterium]|nr:methyltransferase domain-containing protein [Betaproteobacteria bacterium]
MPPRWRPQLIPIVPPRVPARPTAGESVMDLGSGAGFECLAAAVEVGRGGQVVGIDMTPDMVRLARRDAADTGVTITHFLQADMECLPFPDACFEVVISNCAINLCAEKARVFAEACRVLKPNGRLAVADIVAVAPLPASVQEDLALHTDCVAVAMQLEMISGMLGKAGFTAVEIAVGEHSRPLLETWAPDSGLGHFVAAAIITARKQAEALPK